MSVQLIQQRPKTCGALGPVDEHGGVPRRIQKADHHAAVVKQPLFLGISRRIEQVGGHELGY